MKKLQAFHSNPTSITTTNTTAVSALVLKVDTLNAIGKKDNELCEELIVGSQVVSLVHFRKGNSGLPLKKPQDSPHYNTTCNSCQQWRVWIFSDIFWRI